LKRTAESKQNLLIRVAMEISSDYLINEPLITRLIILLPIKNSLTSLKLLKNNRNKIKVLVKILLDAFITKSKLKL